MPYIIIILLRHTLLKQADKLFLFDGKKRCTLTLAIPHQDIAHNGKSAYLHGGSALYRRNILQQDFLPPSKPVEKQQQFIVGSNGIGSMNQLLDTDNQQKHKKDSDENLLFPKAVNGYYTCQSNKQILSGSDTRMKNSIHFIRFLPLR